MKRAIIGAGMLLLFGGAIGGGCAQAPLTAAVRALQSAGPVAFVCLGAPGALEDVALPLTACGSGRTSDTADFSIPHLYALVTQPHIGEVAVIDLTTRNNPLIDQNPIVPGASFLPVGAITTDIVATPGGSATFVSAAEPGFEAIYALPSDAIRGGSPRLSSWPSCALPAAPGSMVLVIDPPDAEGDLRPRCDEPYGGAEVDEGCEGVPHCHGDLAADALRAGRPGRYKLAVALPDEGGIAIIDAQDILDQEAGTRAPCPIDRWLPLDVSQVVPPPTLPPAGDACVPHTGEDDLTLDAFVSRPSDLASDGKRLYVADRGAPLIHRLDMPTPCEPVALPPLLATSAEDPDRVVTTRKVAVSPTTLGLEQFVYAVDDEDGSIMMFDVSEGSTRREPIQRPAPELNPFQPPDRIRFGSPPREIVITQIQSDKTIAETGATVPVRCEPLGDGPGAVYRTNAALTEGAGPTRLRGVFAFAVLESGDVVVIDIDDYDGACRGPREQSLLRGCEPPLVSETLATANEFSCRTVSPHEARSASFLLTLEGTVNREPGLSALPLLFDVDGSVIQIEDASPDIPRMLATIPADNLVVGSGRRTLAPATGFLTTGAGADPGEHTLSMNLADPRAHILSQGWSVVYEGTLPGFNGRFASFSDLGGGAYELREVTSAFCDRGVQSEAALLARLLAEGAPEAAATARRHADYVQIVSRPPAESDPYWGSQNSCTFISCQQAFGTVDNALETRDFRIVEATQDALSLVQRGAEPTAPIKCCFPAVVEFRVRGGNQWVVVGDQVGFLHRMTVSDEGTCLPSCDPARERLDGRVIEAPPLPSMPSDSNFVAVDSPFAFQNPFFRFAIYSGASERDMRFSFSTQNAFAPLTRTMVTNNPDVQPMAARFLPNTGELVISDGSLEGIVLMDLRALAVTRQFN